MPNPSIQSSKKNGLTDDQSWLMNRMRALGYKINEGGVCHGITNMGIQAYLVGELDKFTTRLRALDSMTLDDDFKQRLEKQLAHEGEAFKNGIHEDPDIVYAKDIYAFCDGIVLYQSPNHYSDILLESKQRENPARQLVQPSAYETLTSYPSLTGIYTCAEDIKTYLKCLQAALGTIPFSIHLSTGNHAVSLHFAPETQQWLYFDPNRMDDTFDSDLDGLAVKILSSEGYIGFFDSSIACSSENKSRMTHLLENLNQQTEWSNLHRLTAEKIEILSHPPLSETDRSYFVHICEQGNLLKVKEFLELPKEIIEKICDGRYVRHFLVSAILSDNEKLVQFLLQASSIKNRVEEGLCREDLFNVAVRERHPGIIRLLVNYAVDKKIDGFHIMRKLESAVKCRDFEVVDCITTAIDPTKQILFRETLDSLEKITPAERGVFINARPELISTGLQLARVVHLLTQEDIESFLSLRQGMQPEIIMTQDDFILALNWLDPNKSAILYDSFKMKLSEIIMTANAAVTFLQEVPAELHPLVYKTIEDNLHDIVKTAKDWDDLWPSYGGQLKNGKIQSPDAIKTLEQAYFNLTKNIIPDLLNTRADLICVLAKGRRLDIYELVKSKLPVLIKTLSDVMEILPYLTPEQRGVFINARPELISTGLQLARVMHLLTQEDIESFLSLRQGMQPEIIMTQDDFILALNWLDPNKSAILYDSFKMKLSEIIMTANAAVTFLQEVPAELYPLVYKTIEDNLHDIVKTVKDWDDLWPSCGGQLKNGTIQLPDAIKTVEQAYFNLTKNIIPDLLNTRADLICVLAKGRRLDIYELVKSKLPVLIKTSSDVMAILPYFTLEQCIAATKNAVIKAEEFHGIVKKASQHGDGKLYSIFKSRLPDVVKSATDLGFIFEYFTWRQRSPFWSYSIARERIDLIEAIKDKLPELIKTADDFSMIYPQLLYKHDLYNTLTSEQLCMAYESCKNHLPNIIQSVMDLNKVLQHLTPEQGKTLLTACKDKFSTIIKTPTDLDTILTLLVSEEKPINPESFFKIFTKNQLESLFTAEHVDQFMSMPHLTQELKSACLVRLETEGLLQPIIRTLWKKKRSEDVGSILSSPTRGC